jgi:hypothetical protein
MMTPGEILVCGAVVFAAAVVLEVFAIQEIIDYLEWRASRKGKRS